MIEVRFHGRGGQGAVTSAELIAQAAIGQGKYAQAFPSFGPERRGAPVLAFLRVSEKPIRLRSRVYKPDAVIILDSTLLGTVNPTEGLKDGFVIINTHKSVEELRWLFPATISPALMRQRSQKRNSGCLSPIPPCSGPS